MAKKQSISLPTECCGVCTFSRNENGDLLCYGSPPVILVGDSGQEYSIRGSVVTEADPICSLFKPRLHS